MHQFYFVERYLETTDGLENIFYYTADDRAPRYWHRKWIELRSYEFLLEQISFITQNDCYTRQLCQKV